MANQIMMGLDRQHIRGVALTTAVYALPAITGGASWLYFLIPLPFVFYTISLGFDRGFKIITQAMLIAGLLVLIFGSLSALLMSFSLLPVGFILARGLNRKEPVLHTALKAVVCLSVTWLATGFIVGAANNINLYSETLKSIDTGLNAAYEAYSKSPEITADSQLELKAAFEKIRETVPRIMPGVLALTTICTVFINILLANWFLEKSKSQTWQNFSQWRLPEQLIWPFIAAGLALIVPSKALNTTALNILLIVGTIYSFQGLAVMASFLTKWSIPKPVRFFIVFFLIIQAYGIIILALLGMADIWADFRKPKNTET